MKINNKNYRTIWEHPEKSGIINIIDQSKLPFEFQIIELSSGEDLIYSIKNMLVRGAPLIGAAAAYAMYVFSYNLKKQENIDINIFNKELDLFSKKLIDSRPTAVNLSWAVKKSLDAAYSFNSIPEKINSLLETARKITEDDVSNCKKIGEFGFEIIKNLFDKKHRKINILTHCNAGWLATIDHGTALAPIYEARNQGIDLHVWVDETRPRCQGSRLTSFELMNENISNTIICDNSAGYLMSRGLVDLVIVGSDRTALNGDVCNKIGTYQKALAANDNNIPFYVALPISTIDINIQTGAEIPIEERDPDEIIYFDGLNESGQIQRIRTAAENCTARNFAFDITPSRLVTGLITEMGIIKPNEVEIINIINSK